MRRFDRLRTCFAAALAVMLFAPLQAHGSTALAYVGPGAGIAFAGSLFVLIGAFLAVFAALAVMPIRLSIKWWSTRNTRRNAKAKQVVIVGLDGFDPEMCRKYMAQGRMPNFQKLADQGVFQDLETATPSMSPVAWSSFMTGVDPGRHGIFDFITRDPCTYLPMLSSALIGAPKNTIKIGKYLVPLGKPLIKMLRKSKPFWQILGDHWVFSSILRVPITFPPEKSKNTVLLSGMCVPDLKGTQGSFAFFTTKQRGRLQDEASVMSGENAGGVETVVQRVGDVVEGEIEGPANSMIAGEPAMKVPFKLTLHAGTAGGTLEVCGKTIPLKMREYTDWIPIEFPAMPLVKVGGIVRFYLMQTDPDLELYMTPIHLDPAKPALPISEPPVYSVYLSKKLGPFATLGLAEDTWALNERRLDEEGFLKQAWLYYEERERMLWEALDKTRKGLVTVVFDTTDRIQHMFYRYLDPKHPANAGKDTVRFKDTVDELYAKMDELLGRVRAKLSQDSVLIVMSDHGFKQFQRGVNLNAWLRDEGYLVLKDGRHTGGDWFEHIDWSKTKAFTMGLTGVFINRKGRETGGIVQEGEELEALKAELIQKLENLTDPGREQHRAIRRVYDATRHLQGPYTYEAPDLLIGYDAGYRHSWDAAVGCTSEHVFTDNTKSWSGDHCMDPKIVPGIFFCNRKINTEEPNILDLAPSVLDLFGVPAPKYMQGRSLFGAPVRTPAEVQA